MVALHVEARAAVGDGAHQDRFPRPVIVQGFLLGEGAAAEIGRQGNGGLFPCRPVDRIPPEGHWHDLQACADAAKIKADLNQQNTSKSLRANWLTVRDWKSNARFPDMKVSKQDLNDLFVAVCNDADGVWQWLNTIYSRS